MGRFLRVFAIIVVAVALTGAAGVAWLSRDVAASHPTLAQADLPPLIPVRDFWADTDSEWRYAVSADGNYIAHMSVRRTQEVVLIKRAADMTELAAIPDTWTYFWSDIAPELYIITHEERMWRVDPENAGRDAWVDVTPRGFSNWNVNTSVRGPDDAWIVTSRDRNPAFPDLYKVRQDGGGKQLFVENEGKTLNWLLDHDQVPLLRFDRAENDETEVLVRDAADGTTWRALFTLDAFETFWVMAVAPDAATATAFSSRGRDRSALVTVDLTTGVETVLVEDPKLDLLRGRVLAPFIGQVDLVERHFDGAGQIAVSERGKTLLRLVAEYGDQVEIESLRSSGNGRFVAATLSPDALNYIYVMFDLEQETSKQLGTFAFRQKHLAKLVPTQEVVIPARDGLDIPALLLRPKGVDGPAPTIVEVHGGPASHVEWQYNHFRQFLVNRGYAVLSVNFRGSTGFGRAFQAKAFKQFGRAMQTDIYDAAEWAVAQGIADPDALAIMGGSYGGYAAGMGATEKDGPFDAAVVEHAVLDVPYQMRNNPFAWGLNTVYMERYFGTIDDPQDLADMTTYSPITRAADLAMPTLVVAGKRDRIVGFEQSEEFLRAARAAGHTPEELIFEDEGHGIDRWQNSLRHSRVVEDFLAKHLGGRSGGWDYMELPAEYLD